MVNGNAGKGSKVRPFDRKKWDEWWDKWEANREHRQELARRRIGIGGRIRFMRDD